MRALGGLLVSSAVLIGGCGGESSTGSPTTSSTSTSSTGSPTTGSTSTGNTGSPTTGSRSPSTTAAGGMVVKVASSQFGPVLFDGTGQAIYIFDAEKTGKPTCYGDCAIAWPPVLTSGEPVAGGAVMQSLLGTTGRSDGSTQVTYGGKPLYFYAHEGKNEVLCHNVRGFGGLWLAVTASGARVP